MKILFLTGGAEPGTDGVGDYTVCLAQKMQHDLACQCEVLAFNDKLCIEKKVTSLDHVSIYRLPSVWDWQKKRADARKIVEEFAPDVISIQFVLFSYDNKGLPFKIPAYLKEVTMGFRTEIMFHELWVGIGNASLKMSLWGSLQKIIIKRLIHSLKPIVIHTQASLYVQLLEGLGFEVRQLPLFANIQNFGGAKEKDPSTIRIVFFGSLHPGADIDSFYSKLKEKIIAHPLEIFFLGNNGNELAQHVELCNKLDIPYQILGRLPAEEISAYFNTADFGVSTGSLNLLDKNSTVASMLFHKLPILSIGNEGKIDGANLPDVKGVYHLENLDLLLMKKPTFEFLYTLDKIARQFLNDITVNR